jgi:uncharacterized membrane protein YgdD (TMEM256/DUF423 family)
LGFAGVALGAFGAHALKATLVANGRADTFELAVRYLHYHAMALFVIGFLYPHRDGAAIRWVGVLQLTGVLLFSGSLLVLALANWRPIAMVTPLGGILMLAGWGLLIYTLAYGRKQP